MVQDRTNVANARVAGLEKELKMTDKDVRSPIQRIAGTYSTDYQFIVQYSPDGHICVRAMRPIYYRVLLTCHLQPIHHRGTPFEPLIKETGS